MSNSLTETWNGLSKNEKIGFGVAVVGVVGFALWSKNKGSGTASSPILQARPTSGSGGPGYSTPGNVATSNNNALAIAELNATTARLQIASNEKIALARAQQAEDVARINAEAANKRAALSSLAPRQSSGTGGNNGGKAPDKTTKTPAYLFGGVPPDDTETPAGLLGGTPLYDDSDPYNLHDASTFQTQGIADFFAGGPNTFDSGAMAGAPDASYEDGGIIGANLEDPATFDTGGLAGIFGEGGEE